MRKNLTHSILNLIVASMVFSFFVFAGTPDVFAKSRRAAKHRNVNMIGKKTRTGKFRHNVRKTKRSVPVSIETYSDSQPETSWVEISGISSEKIEVSETVYDLGVIEKKFVDPELTYDLPILETRIQSLVVNFEFPHIHIERKDLTAEIFGKAYAELNLRTVSVVRVVGEKNPATGYILRSCPIPTKPEYTRALILTVKHASEVIKGGMDSPYMRIDQLHSGETLSPKYDKVRPDVVLVQADLPVPVLEPVKFSKKLISGADVATIGYPGRERKYAEGILIGQDIQGGVVAVDTTMPKQGASGSVALNKETLEIESMHVSIPKYGPQDVVFGVKGSDLFQILNQYAPDWEKCPADLVARNIKKGITARPKIEVSLESSPIQRMGELGQKLVSLGFRLRVPNFGNSLAGKE